MPPANLVGLEPLIVAVIKLSVSVSGDDVVLSWPEEFSSFSLEETGNLNPPFWQVVSSERTTTAVSVVVTLPLAGTPRFFRLATE